jgi:hypothetical protein
MRSQSFKTEAFRISAVTLFLLQTAVLILVAPLQIDPHHDGIILGAAIASSTGQLGPSEAFSQYGPLSPLLHGWFLNIFGNSMLNLRYFAALNALLISFLLFNLMRKLANHWTALIISTSWICTSAIWSTTFPGALLPWPSLIATALLLGGINLLFPIFAGNNFSQGQMYLRIVLAGSFFGLTGFARQQTWLAAIITMLLLTFYFKRISKEVIIFASGVITSVSLIFAWLIHLGAWNSYLNQVIIWPLSAYSTLGVNNNYNRYQFASYLIQSIVLLMVIYVIAKLRHLIKSTFLIYIIVFIASSLILFTGFSISKQTKWNSTLRVIIGEPQEKLVVSLGYFACVAAILIPAYIIVRYKFRVPREQYQALFIAGVGLVGVIQLYPQPDVLHLWWVAPVFFPCSLIGLELVARKVKSISIDDLTIATSTFSALGLILAASYIARPWAPYEIPVLKGTYTFQEKANAINQFMKIQKYIVSGKTSFDCPDGVFAVSNKEYQATDEWFVNWGMLKSDSPIVGEVRVICYRDLEYIQGESERLGMQIESYQPTDYADVSFAVLVARK